MRKAMILFVMMFTSVTVSAEFNRNDLMDSLTEPWPTLNRTIALMELELDGAFGELCSISISLKDKINVEISFDRDEAKNIKSSSSVYCQLIIERLVCLFNQYTNYKSYPRKDYRAYIVSNNLSAVVKKGENPNYDTLAVFEEGRINWRDGNSEELDFSQTDWYYETIDEFTKMVKTVAKIISGDTFILEDGTTIKLIGVECPEEGEMGYEKASMYTSVFVLGEWVFLKYDKKQFDDHDNTLAYVFVGGVCLNEELLNRGLAKVTHQFDFSEKSKYLALEKEAKGKMLGIWK